MSTTKPTLVAKQPMQLAKETYTVEYIINPSTRRMVKCKIFQEKVDQRRKNVIGIMFCFALVTLMSGR